MKLKKIQPNEKSTIKKEKTNGCFFKKKDVSNQLDFFKNLNKTNFSLNSIKAKNYPLFFDEEKQLFFLPLKNKRFESLGISFKTNFFFHFEEIFFFNFLDFQFKKKKAKRIFKNLFYGKIKTKNVFLYFFVFLFLKKSGFFVQRFRLFDEHSIRPKFFCWNKNKILKTIFSLLIFTKPFSPGFLGLFSKLLTRLKPSPLKIAVISKSVVMFFSVDNGFTSTCPIFCKKIKQKKKLI
ncbi:hypothetical protein HAN_1g61 (nucleomorph) [Hemiselmis andersenii]|uniref:Uncharacterized protein n=1 Tax=Hemiselmis andersenii TaxID=464988 RepID=A9BK73_HEMAN|nr:hypothetical protein HAN_1g61 [Hemiselmis andersenii]ABW97906.1 hypothetical protein HAN_1g61 [Hemiselmis andersenii]|mmetsp:Transcript_15988/g.38690  ORF Transcript_15988/g.38690 Transcript_15988/m.38690 type:complete len:236 (+) Transcript_15988:169-876(+)